MASNLDQIAAHKRQVVLMPSGPADIIAIVDVQNAVETQVYQRAIAIRLT
ncbi:hypothetical protein [Burkholderia glumae]